MYSDPVQLRFINVVSDPPPVISLCVGFPNIWTIVWRKLLSKHCVLKRGGERVLYGVTVGRSYGAQYIVKGVTSC